MLNRPEEISRVFRPALENATVEARGADAEMTERRQTENVEDDEKEDALLVARKTRDALIKSIAIGGLPKVRGFLFVVVGAKCPCVAWLARHGASQPRRRANASSVGYQAINSLYALKRATPAALLDDATDPSPTLDRCRSPEDILAGGQSLFDRVYGKVSTRVMSQMDRCGTSDLGVAARWMYGGILSGVQTKYNVLSPVEISFVLMAGLIPQDVSRPCWPTYVVVTFPESRMRRFLDQTDQTPLARNTHRSIHS